MKRRPRLRALALAGVLALAAPLLAGVRADGADGTGTHGGDLVLPPAVRRPADRRRPREVTNLTQPGQEPHDLELTVRQTAAVADADVLRLRARLPGRRRRRRRPERPATTSWTPRRPPTCPATTRTSGSTRPSCRRSPPRSSEQLAAADPAHAADYARNLAGLQCDLAALDRDFRTGLAHCRIHHDRGQPRRVRLPRPPLRPRGRRHQRPLPRRRALARPRPRAPGPDPLATASPRCSPRSSPARSLRRQPGRRPRHQRRGARPDRGTERRHRRPGLPLPDAAEPRAPSRRRTSAHERSRDLGPRRRRRARRPAGPARHRRRRPRRRGASPSSAPTAPASPRWCGR